MNDIFIIAEISANHNNDINTAYKTIDAIADSGADCVKVQTYTADSLTMNVDNEYFGPKKDGPWKGKTLHELYTEGSMPYEWQPKLKKYTEDRGLIFFSSPFDENAVDFLEDMDTPMYKIASPEINDIPLIEYAASKGKPMIISTGMANLSDIELAVNACRKVGNNDITLLKCTSECPATPEMANLLTIPNLKETFNVKVGLSDHTMGSTIPIAAVALGATVIEKHFILDRNQGGPDALFSMEPHEFKDMVEASRNAYKALGEIKYELTERNRNRRCSLFIAEDVKAGEIITEKNVKSVRPGFGLPPVYLSDILGKEVNRDLKKGTPMKFEFLG